MTNHAVYGKCGNCRSDGVELTVCPCGCALRVCRRCESTVNRNQAFALRLRNRNEGKS